MENASKQFRKRNAILAHLRATCTHPSAEELYRELSGVYPDISLATVYRNLALFKEQGLAVSIGTVKGIERFDGCVTPHVHFTCTSCGCVQDVPELAVPQSLTESASTSLACRVDSASLIFHGLCAACLSQVNN